MNQVVDKEQTAIFAEEAFVVDVQSFLHHMMEDKGFSRADLAKAMGVSRARITQIFSDESKNFTIRLLARAAHAMGESIELDARFLRESRAREAKKNGVLISGRAKSNVVPLWSKMNDFEDSDVIDCHIDERLRSFVSLSAGYAEAA
jgi:transcriptional regulator with XRE-family HTH domain